MIKQAITILLGSEPSRAIVSFVEAATTGGHGISQAASAFVRSHGVEAAKAS